MFRRWKVLENDVKYLVAEADMMGIDISDSLATVPPVLSEEYKLFLQNREQEVFRRSKILGVWDRSSFDSTLYSPVFERFYNRTKEKKFYKELLEGLPQYENGVIEESRLISALCSLKTHLNISDQYLIPIVTSQVRWNQIYQFYNNMLTLIIYDVEKNKKIILDNLYIIYDLLYYFVVKNNLQDDYKEIIKGSLWQKF